MIFYMFGFPNEAGNVLKWCRDNRIPIILSYYGWDFSVQNIRHMIVNSRSARTDGFAGEKTFRIRRPDDMALIILAFPENNFYYKSYLGFVRSKIGL